MKTSLCEKLGMEVPIMQAAIGGGITCPALAAAVSNAGGLGSLALTGRGKDGTREVLRATRRLTSRALVANLLLSYDIEAELEAILEHPPCVVSFFWGDIDGYVERIKSAGAMIMTTVGSVDEARRAADAGADIVIAQGWEAGGHVRGEVSTLALVPAVVDAIDPVPVVAAGGIADGRGLAAALCLGAQAAWIGTRFLAANEADVHPVYRGRILASVAADTFYSKLYDGTWPDAPGRVLRNSTIEAWEAAGKPASGQRPGEGERIARDADGYDILRYDARALTSSIEGEIEAGPLWAGQAVGLVQQADSAAAIIDEIMQDAREVLARQAGGRT